jgi:hypothetical protein
VMEDVLRCYVSGMLDQGVMHVPANHVALSVSACSAMSGLSNAT